MENNEEIVIPDYEEELAAILSSDLPDEEILAQLDNYHENDIAGALQLLSEEDRKKLYHVLGAERVSEIFTYIDERCHCKDLNIWEFETKRMCCECKQEWLESEMDDVTNVK